MTEEESCSQKLAFDTQPKAQAEATKIEWQRGIKLKVYQCSYCSLWHLSTSPETSL